MFRPKCRAIVRLISLKIALQLGRKHVAGIII